MAVAIVALPLALRPASVPAPERTDPPTALRTAGPVGAGVGTMGPHGDDVDRPTDPPIDRAALAEHARSAPFLSGYQWPLKHARITNAFGKGYPGSFLVDGVTAHDGIDLATWCGDRIVAAHDGYVLSAGRHHEGYVGWLGDLTAYRAKLDADGAWGSRAIAVVIDDGNGYRSVYVHLRRANVQTGDVVHAGDLIGWEGATGNATGCHLHYSLFRPTETDWWLLDPDARGRSLLPDREIARIDPLLVLPSLSDAGIVWGWGVRQTD